MSGQELAVVLALARRERVHRDVRASWVDRRRADDAALAALRGLDREEERDLTELAEGLAEFWQVAA